MTSARSLIDDATAWHLASQSDDMDWDAFTLWLEADPAHARAYDEIALADAVLADAVQQGLSWQEAGPVAANDEMTGELPAINGRWRWAGMAIAASLVALVSVAVLRPDASTVYQTQTDSMTITLDDGSTVILAPASELTVDGADQQHLALAGAAFFDIRHDPSRQMTIDAGSFAITDIGTSFDVQVAEDDVRIAVSEGRVSVASDRLAERVELVAGRQLHFNGSTGRSVTAPVGVDTVGGWREGQLSYSAIPLSLVSADLSRYAGVELEVPADLGDRLFSGTLSIDDGNSAVRDLSQLMGLRLERGDGVYRLGEPAN